MNNERLFVLCFIVGISAVFFPLIIYNAWKLDKEWAEYHPPMTEKEEEKSLELKAFSCLLSLRDVYGINYEYSENQKKLGKYLINDLFCDDKYYADKLYSILFEGVDGIE